MIPCNGGRRYEPIKNWSRLARAEPPDVETLVWQVSRTLSKLSVLPEAPNFDVN